jgi:hypothetical protein
MFCEEHKFGISSLWRFSNLPLLFQFQAQSMKRYTKQRDTDRPNANRVVGLIVMEQVCISLYAKRETWFIMFFKFILEYVIDCVSNFVEIIYYVYNEISGMANLVEL